MRYIQRMTTTVKIISVGNSAGIILPKEILEKLRVSKGDSLTVTESPTGVNLTAYDEKIARQMQVAEQVMRDNRNMLRKLAQ